MLFYNLVHAVSVAGCYHKSERKEKGTVSENQGLPEGPSADELPLDFGREVFRDQRLVVRLKLFRVWWLIRFRVEVVGCKQDNFISQVRVLIFFSCF